MALNCPKCGQKIAFSTNQSEPDAPAPKRPAADKPRSEKPKRALRSAAPRQEPKSTEDKDEDAFEFFGVDDKPKRTPRELKETKSKREPATAIRNRRERKRPEGKSPVKGLIIAASVGVPLLLCVVGAWFWVGSNDTSSSPTGSGGTIAATQPATDSVPDLPPGGQTEPDVARAPAQQPGRQSVPPLDSPTTPPIQKRPDIERPPAITRRPPSQPSRPAVQPPPVARPAKRNGKGLRYGWAKGDQHVYALTVEADNDGTKSVIHGSCTYTVRGVSNNVQKSESSGTGFVVGADGYIATCAHVVEDATEIKVTLNGQDYSARVLAADEKLDLAVIKIEASGLNVLPFGDSDQVQLLQEIQAFGFPLSSLLGTGLKANSGKVSGTVDTPEHGRQIQIDAAINPGNSGGPVMNNEGQVLGVASSKLVNSIATAVGFAVPVNELKTMLRELGVSIPEPGDGQKLEGVQLAAMATPAVAFIKVKSSTGGQVFDVAYNAMFSQADRADPRARRFAPPSLPTVEHTNGNIKVTSLGEIVGFSGDGSLPFVLGPIGQMFIDPLNKNGQAQWGGESDGSVSIVQKGNSGPFGGIPGFGRRGFGPRGFPGSPFNQPADKTLKTIPAKERVDYRLGVEVGNRIGIHKTYEFITSDNEQKPYLVIRGEGDIVFDKAVGMPAKYDYKGSVVKTDKYGSKRMPLTVSFVLRDPEEVNREKAESQAR
ncbi:MAG: trypsin-like peptidase domain-containing protein, partial [Planctomycetaceae bacterium]